MLVLLANLLLAAVLTGLIFTVQLVVYPQFAVVPPEALPAYALQHQRAITPLVGPLMLAEVVAALMLTAYRPAAVPAWLPWAAGAALAIIWACTAFVSVPLHGRLATGDTTAIAPLVLTNWLRTAAWTLRLSLLGWAAWLCLPR